MGTRKTSDEKKAFLFRFVKESPTYQGKNVTKKEAIGRLMVNYGTTRRYAMEIIQAFIDVQKIKEVLTEGEIYLL